MHSAVDRGVIATAKIVCVTIRKCEEDVILIVSYRVLISCKHELHCRDELFMSSPSVILCLFPSLLPCISLRFLGTEARLKYIQQKKIDVITYSYPPNLTWSMLVKDP